MNAPKLRFNEFNNEWISNTIGEISIMFSGGTPKSTNRDFYDNGEIPFIRSGEIDSDSTELHISEEALKSSSAKMVDKGDLLYALYGATSGEVSISKIEGAINQAILCIKPNCNVYFLKSFLEAKKKIIISKFLQGGQGNLSATLIKQLNVNIPTVEEQEKISSFIEKLNLKIKLQQEKIDLLKEQKKGFLQKIFSQELRFKGEFGQELPKWEKILVKDVLSLNLREISKPNSAYTRLGLRSHAKGTFHELVPDVKAVNMDKLYEVHEGDFIINITFAWEQALAVAQKEDHGKLVSHRFPTYRFKETHDKNFYKYFFTTKYFKYCLGNASPGGAGRNRVLNKTDFMKIEIIVPTFKEQLKISNFLDILEEKIILTEQKLKTLKAQKKSLMQQMFI
ncbi:MAG: restriction endonuclease subunit S [Bacillota bacterium]